MKIVEKGEENRGSDGTKRRRLLQNDDDCFTDALDDFPFHDCDDAYESEQSPSTSTISEISPDSLSPKTNLRRRRQTSFLPVSSEDVSSISNVEVKSIYSEKNHKIHDNFKEDTNSDSTESSRTIRDRLKPEVSSESVVSTANDDRVGGSVDPVDQLGDSPSSPNFLLLIVGFVLKAIGFQLIFLFKLITFPLRALYSTYMFIIDPFGFKRRLTSFFMQKLYSILSFVGLFARDRFKEQKTVWRLLLRFGCCLLWFIYVGSILFGLLFVSVMFTGFFMNNLVEKPMQIRKDLNFDYTKTSPVAFVPLISCDAAGSGVDCVQKVDDFESLGPRVVPFSHKLQATVLLTLPESDYNRELGIFQVQIDFLSADGKIIASKRQPCLLKFRSEPVRLLSTFLKFVPLVTGYASESQIMELKIGGFTEGRVPTSCVRLKMDSRAEYGPGAGIPELYDASLVLESELPLFKRMIWYWKKTIFIWISLMLFTVELLFTFICCKCVNFSQARPMGDSSANNFTPTSQNQG